ncbi:MAG: hypothetical protein IPJ02_14865 [Chitinophagaceae bacterium]|nr:hypothetical protein [Chitinophagaceae bacterium]
MNKYLYFQQAPARVLKKHIKMIEQTELLVSKWEYNPPLNTLEDTPDKLTSYITLDVMKLRAASKKGIACRFTCEFVFEKRTLLEYVAANTYVIDLPDLIDRNELQTMIRNTYSLFKDKFDIRKLGTALQDKTLLPFDESRYDLEPVLALLNQ